MTVTIEGTPPDSPLVRAEIVVSMAVAMERTCGGAEAEAVMLLLMAAAILHMSCHGGDAAEACKHFGTAAGHAMLAAEPAWQRRRNDRPQHAQTTTVLQ